MFDAKYTMAAFPLPGQREPGVGPIASDLELQGQNQAAFPLSDQQPRSATLKPVHNMPPLKDATQTPYHITS